MWVPTMQEDAMPRASDQRKARCESRNPCGERGRLEEGGHSEVKPKVGVCV